MQNTKIYRSGNLKITTNFSNNTIIADSYYTNMLTVENNKIKINTKIIDYSRSTNRHWDCALNIISNTLALSQQLRYKLYSVISEIKEFKKCELPNDPDLSYEANNELYRAGVIKFITEFLGLEVEGCSRKIIAVIKL